MYYSKQKQSDSEECHDKKYGVGFSILFIVLGLIVALNVNGKLGVLGDKIGALGDRVGDFGDTVGAWGESVGDTAGAWGESIGEAGSDFGDRVTAWSETTDETADSFEGRMDAMANRVETAIGDEVHYGLFGFASTNPARLARINTLLSVALFAAGGFFLYRAFQPRGKAKREA